MVGAIIGLAIAFLIVVVLFGAFLVFDDIRKSVKNIASAQDRSNMTLGEMQERGLV